MYFFCLTAHNTTTNTKGSVFMLENRNNEQQNQQNQKNNQQNQQNQKNNQQNQQNKENNKNNF